MAIVVRVQIALTVQGEKGKRRETIIDSFDVRTSALGFWFYQAVVEEIFRSFTEVKVAILHWEVLSAECILHFTAVELILTTLIYSNASFSKRSSYICNAARHFQRHSLLHRLELYRYFSLRCREVEYVIEK